MRRSCSSNGVSSRCNCSASWLGTSFPLLRRNSGNPTDCSACWRILLTAGCEIFRILAAPLVEPVSMTALKTSMCRKRTCFLRHDNPHQFRRALRCQPCDVPITRGYIVGFSFHWAQRNSGIYSRPQPSHQGRMRRSRGSFMESGFSRWQKVACLSGLFLAWAVGYADRILMSVAVIPIASEFALDASQAGMLLSAFYVSYAVMQLAGGWLSDRYGSRVV